MKKIKLPLCLFFLNFFTVTIAFGQGAPACPSVTVAPPATICSGNCTTLNATLVTNNQTTSYSVASIPYVPYSYTTGTTAIVSQDDVWSGIENIGFDFCYFGNTYSQFIIGANGEIDFNTALAGNTEPYTTTGATLPDGNAPIRKNTINFPYRDIDPAISAPGESVKYQMYGTSPCRALVVSFYNIPLFYNGGGTCDSTPNSTFQCVLYENTNYIDVYIENSYSCSDWNGGLGVIGIQNSTGTVAVTPPGRNNTTFSVNGTPEAWRFTPTGPPSYTLNWYKVGSGTSLGTATTLSVCPTVTTSYAAVMKVTNCDGTSFNESDTVQVVVTPGPTVTAIASPTVLCSGASSTLTASGATNYTWSPGGSTSNPLTVTPGATTTYTVTGTNGGCSGTATVEVIVGPTVITASASPTVLCPGNSATLTATGPAGTTYSWSDGQTTNPISVTPVTTTTYTVTGTNGGCTGTATVTVTINTTLSITANASPTSICSGSSSTLTATGPAGTTYSWSDASTSNPDVVSPVTTTTYTVTGTNGACTGTATVTVIVSPSFVLTANASPTSVCAGSSSTLTATGPVGTTYSWSPGAGTTNPITVTPGATTTYTVTGTNAGCTGTATVTVVFNPVPTVTVNSPAICAGTSATLTANGALTYVWSDTETINPISVSPSSNTSYTVTGTDANGCTNTAVATVTVNPQPTITITGNNTICQGSNTVLTGNGAVSYSWTPSTGLSSSTVPNPTVTVATTTSYTVTGTDANGCTGTATVTVTVNPLPTVTATASASPICLGSSSILTAGGPVGTTYNWSPGGSTANPLTVSPVTTTTYTVTGTNSGCTGTATVTVIVNPSPAIDSLNALFSPICAGTLGSITGVFGTGGTAPYTYSWNPTGQTTPDATGLSAGSYALTVTDASGCSVTSGPYIIANSVVTAGFTANPTSGMMPLSVNFTNTSTGANSYEWNLGNGNNSTGVDPSTVYGATGTYNVELIATNSDGCTDTAYSTIDVFGESMLIVPNVFSPNGDDKNDVFIVKSSDIASFDGQIFDRWGIKLFEWNNVNDGWNGNTKSGEAPSGTYYYLINATGADGKQYQEKGYLTLIR